MNERHGSLILTTSCKDISFGKYMTNNGRVKLKCDPKRKRMLCSYCYNPYFNNNYTEWCIEKN